MGARIFLSPRTNYRSILIENQDVIVGIVRSHKYTPRVVHSQFMAIVYRELPCISAAPLRVNAVPKSVVANNGLWLGAKTKTCGQDSRIL